MLNLFYAIHIIHLCLWKMFAFVRVSACVCVWVCLCLWKLDRSRPHKNIFDSQEFDALTFSSVWLGKEYLSDVFHLIWVPVFVCDFNPFLAQKFLFYFVSVWKVNGQYSVVWFLGFISKDEMGHVTRSTGISKLFGPNLTI